MASEICGEYRSEKVVLSGRALRQDGTTIREVLDRLRGVASLEIMDTGPRGARYDVVCLDLPSLRGASPLRSPDTASHWFLLFAADLTNLSINVRCSDDVPAGLRPSFLLQTLTLGRPQPRPPGGRGSWKISGAAEAR